MKMNVTSHDFVRAFDEYNREDNFSRAGRFALFEWLEEIDPDYELDVIGICCQFVEWLNLEEYREEMDSDAEDYPDDMVVYGYDGERFITME